MKRFRKIWVVIDTSENPTSNPKKFYDYFDAIDYIYNFCDECELKTAYEAY